MKRAVGRALFLVLMVALLIMTMTVHCAEVEHETQEPPEVSEPYAPTGEELWWSLPVELLSNVAEGKMEEIASLEGRIEQLKEDLAAVQEIQHIRIHEQMQQRDMEEGIDSD